MRLEDYDSFCASLPHATPVVQWSGSHVWKVGGKVFAIGSVSDDNTLAITFKCSPMSFELLKDTPGVRPAPYLASRGLLWLQRTSGQSLNDDGLRDYLRESHRLASLKLPKKLQRIMGINQTKR